MRQLSFFVTALAALMPAAVCAAEADDDIIVTASRRPEPAYAVGAAYSVLTGEQIERRQIRVVSDALRQIPGIAVSRSGPPGNLTQIRLRGSEANQTLVLIDGVEVNDPGNFDGGFDFANLLTYNIDRIEVIRGAQSAIYGSDALGGVINIITRRGAGPFSAQASIEGGSHGTGQLTASASGGGERFDAALSGSLFTTGGISQARADLGNTERDPYDNGSFAGRFGFAPTDWLSFTVMGRATRAEVDFDDPPFDSANVTKTRQRWGHADAKITLFDGHVENIVSANLLDMTTRSDFSGFPGSSFGAKKSFSNQINVSGETEFALPASHRLTLYAERERDKGQTSFAGNNEPRITRNTALAAEYQLGLAEMFFISGGVRHDHNDRFADATTYRISGALRLPHNIRLHTTYGTGLKQPTLVELFGFGPGFIGNPNLDPETSKSVDAGLEVGFADGRAKIDVTAFRNDIDNRIQGAGPFAFNITGVTRIQGVEVQGHAELLSWLTLDASYTGMKTQDPGGLEIIRRARHIGSVDLNAELWDGRSTIDLGIDYNGRQRDQDFSLFVFPAPYLNLSGYTLVRLAASYEILEGIALNVRAENLLDQDYEEVLFFGTPGLTVFGGVSLKLGG